MSQVLNGVVGLESLLMFRVGQRGVDRLFALAMDATAADWQGKKSGRTIGSRGAAERSERSAGRATPRLGGYFFLAHLA
jgi:hypothetical protein